MSKDAILKYCDQFSESSIEHIQNALENKYLIERGEYRFLNGCPSSYGLDDYMGLCETEEKKGNGSNKEFEDMCEMCWKKALGVVSP